MSTEQMESTQVAVEPRKDAANQFTPELIAARLAAFQRLQDLLSKGNSTSGRNGRPWREWINDHNDED